MNKGLEAFNRIKSYFHSKQLLTKEMTLNDLDSIEKELKRLEELEKAFDSLSKDDEKAKKELSKEIERTRTLRIIKDKQYYALSTISDVIRDFNKGEFASAEIALQEITALLKEVLL